jgi:phenylalanyl-tRNA synthetase beta chain
MLIDLPTLQSELPTIKDIALIPLCELIASLGFPIDGVHEVNGRRVLDVDVTANRGDVMSHRGLARDLSAKLNASLLPLPRKVLSESDARLSIRLETPACPIYATAILTLGSKQQTPQAVVDFLAALGSSAKQLSPVDASNELLHRYGHPTHAFDADTIQGAIKVRMARVGEKLITLDGVERTLSVKDLIIADERGAIAMAGVMGGDATKVTAATRRVLLESAFFDPRTVRLMAHRHALHSDGSHRFGRGADPAMAKVVRDMLAQRLMEWAGATLEAAWTVGAEPLVPSAISLPERLLSRIAGETIPQEEARDILHRLGCTVLEHPQGLSAVPASWRHDLSISEDLAEEVIRVRGYDRIASVLPPLQGDPEPLNPGYLQRQQLALRLAHLGFHQTVTYGFISPEADAAFASSAPEGRSLGNPLGQDYSVMRGSLLPTLKEAAGHNRRQGQKEVRLFEIAPTYVSSPSGPEATMRLAFVWSGQMGGEDFLTPARSVQPADLLGVAKALRAIDLPKVHDLGDGAFAIEVELDGLAKPESRVIPNFQAFSRFPRIERDLSLLVPMTLSHATLVAAMGSALPKECIDLRCVDVFRHKSLPAGQQAWLMRLIFQADRTLTSEEVDVWMKQALIAAESVGAKLRA